MVRKVLITIKRTVKKLNSTYKTNEINDKVRKLTTNFKRERSFVHSKCHMKLGKFFRKNSLGKMIDRAFQVSQRNMEIFQKKSSGWNDRSLVPNYLNET